jgi:hypothetical protein
MFKLFFLIEFLATVKIDVILGSRVRSLRSTTPLHRVVYAFHPSNRSELDVAASALVSLAVSTPEQVLLFGE